MIDSIGSSANFRPPPQNTNSLSSDQKSLIEDTLSNFDASSLSQEDATSLVQTFSEAGINPGVEFADMLADSGFDAQEIGSLAQVNEGGGGQRPPPPPSGEQSDTGLDLSSIVDYLDELSEADSSEDANSTSTAAQLAARFGLSEGQSLINVTA